MIRHVLWVSIGLLFAVGLLFGGDSAAQGDASGAARFQPGSADTVRTNLWLIEALMREAATAVIQPLPASPAGVRLEPESFDPQEELFTQVLTRELKDRGFVGYLATYEEDVEAESAADYRLQYRVAGIDLAYPETGRRLGIWREWVARRLELTIIASLTESASGRVLFSDRIVRGYGDRVPDEDIETVETGPYDFVDADVKGSGWQNRLEEIVVLATRAGLVAVYFANTQ
jgi:hypothetical protein